MARLEDRPVDRPEMTVDPRQGETTVLPPQDTKEDRGMMIPAARLPPGAAAVDPLHVVPPPGGARLHPARRPVPQTDTGAAAQSPEETREVDQVLRHGTIRRQDGGRAIRREEAEAEGSRTDGADPPRPPRTDKPTALLDCVCCTLLYSCVTLLYTVIQCFTMPYTVVHCFTLLYSTLLCTVLHCCILLQTVLHCFKQSYTISNSCTLLQTDYTSKQITLLQTVVQS